MCVGGEIVSSFDHPELVKLGECKLIEEIMIGEDKVFKKLSPTCAPPTPTDDQVFWREVW